MAVVPGHLLDSIILHLGGNSNLLLSGQFAILLAILGVADAALARVNSIYYNNFNPLILLFAVLKCHVALVDLTPKKANHLVLAQV